MPVALADIDRNVDAFPQGVRLLAGDFVDRRRPADGFIMMRDFINALRWDLSPARDNLQKRPDVFHLFRSAERNEQDRFGFAHIFPSSYPAGSGGVSMDPPPMAAGDDGVCDCEISCTASTSAFTWPTGVFGKTP